MAKRTRRAKSSSNKSLTSWPRVLLIIVPLFVAVFIMFNSQNGQNILGVKDSNFFGLGEKVKPSGTPKPPKPSCNRVTSFSASTICERSDKEKTNNAFKSYSYTCEDGTSGSLEQTQVEGRCIPIEKAYQAARKACNKKCLPAKSPTPTPEIQSQ